MLRPRLVPVVYRFGVLTASSNAFILRRGLVDRSEERLISCWNRCCNLAVRFILVNSASVLSREQVLWRGLDFNLGDGEKKWYFWRIFGFDGLNISAVFLCFRGDIVKILCSNVFWSGHPCDVELRWPWIMGVQSTLIFTSIELNFLQNYCQKLQCNHDHRLVQQKIEIRMLYGWNCETF